MFFHPMFSVAGQQKQSGRNDGAPRRGSWVTANREVWWGPRVSQVLLLVAPPHWATPRSRVGLSPELFHWRSTVNPSPE